MSNIVTILLGVLGTALTALVSWGVERLIAWLNTKIKNEKAAAIMGNALSVVASTVKSTFQTYVESIKGTDAWTAEAQKKALDNSLAHAKNMLSTEVKDYIIANYGDLTEWLTSEIEAKIYELKNGTEAANEDC